MTIRINNKEIEIISGETVLEAAGRIGCDIPALCYAKGKKHQSSCLVCAVKNQANGQIIPACTSYPTEGMQIETDSEEVRTIRTLSLELLLSDHRADCDAPCSMVCPKGLDVAQMLSYYDVNQHDKAFQVVSATFTLSAIPCDTCHAPCEKACRRGTVDKAVSIRDIIKQIVEMSMSDNQIHGDDGMDFNKQIVDMSKHNTSSIENRPSSTDFSPEHPASNPSKTNHTIVKNTFQSRLGRFSAEEKERLKTTVTTHSRCLHCACAGKSTCKLRPYATAAGIKRPRYESSSALPVMNKQQINEKVWFEQAKCIRCGLCVYNSENGFTFKDRGFYMSVFLPEENRQNIKNELATLCPTGAIYESITK